MKLAKIFSDGAILQRGKPVCVWGFFAVGEVVLTLLCDQGEETYRAKANANGEFSFTLKPHLGGDGAYVMRVCDAKDSIEIRNIRFGEVILTMGQSNMAYAVESMVNCEEILALARRSTIATFDVFEAYQQTDGSIFRPSAPEQDFAGDWHWIDGTAHEIKKSSGVAVMAALRIAEKLKVPVGLINTALGGVSIDTYLPRWVADEYSSIGEHLKKIDKYIPEGGEYNVYGGANYTQLGGIYNEKIAPIRRFTVGGIFWYQGENAVSDWDGAVYYRKALRVLIAFYQGLFGSEIPFICSQIALDHYPYSPYGYNYINEAIDLAAKESQGNVHSFPVYDASIEWMKRDGLLYYHPIHPIDKRLIASRFARIFLAARKGEYSYPYIAKVERKGECLEAVVAPSGVRLKKGKVTGFTIAGADGKFVLADAEVIGENRIRVSSPYVKDPTELTYAFAQYNDICNLRTTRGESVKPYRAHIEPWTARGYLQLNAFSECNRLRGVERCFGADLGCIGDPYVWTDGKITRTNSTALSICKRKGENSLCIRFSPTNDGYYYFGVSPEIALAGYEVPFDRFRYLTVRMKAEQGKKVEFQGVLVREGQGKLHRFVGTTMETSLSDGWQEYTVCLEKFIEGDLSVCDASMETRKNIHTAEFFFRAQEKGKLWMDCVRFHD